MVFFLLGFSLSFPGIHLKTLRAPTLTSPQSHTGQPLLQSQVFTKSLSEEQLPLVIMPKKNVRFQ